MKLTKQQLKQIIKEKLEDVLREATPGPGAHAGRLPKHDPEKAEWVDLPPRDKDISKKEAPPSTKEAEAAEMAKGGSGGKPWSQETLEKFFTPRERVHFKVPYLKAMKKLTRKHLKKPSSLHPGIEGGASYRELPKFPEAASGPDRENFLKSYKDPKGLKRRNLEREIEIGKKEGRLPPEYNYEDNVLPWIIKQTYETPVHYKKMHPSLAGSTQTLRLPGRSEEFDIKSGTMIPGRKAGKLEQAIALNLIPLEGGRGGMPPPEEKGTLGHEQSHAISQSFTDPDAPILTGGLSLSEFRSELADSLQGPALKKWNEKAIQCDDEGNCSIALRRPYMLDNEEFGRRVDSINMKKEKENGKGILANDYIDICAGKLGRGQGLRVEDGGTLDCEDITPEKAEKMADKMRKLSKVDLPQMQQGRSIATEQQKMKFTKSQLKQLIKEKLDDILLVDYDPNNYL